jgi:hypothetical protein
MTLFSLSNNFQMMSCGNEFTICKILFYAAVNIMATII